MTTLSTIRFSMERSLSDTGNAVWETEVLDEGLRRALGMYSKARPRAAITTITIAADGREVDVSGVSGLLNIQRVWIPYDSSNPAHPPLYRNFEHWADQQLIYVEDYYPSEDDVLRLFYTAVQTVEDLDSATSTTVQADDIDILVEGAAGYAILTEATIATKEVQIDAVVPVSVQLLKIAETKLSRFFGWIGLEVNGKATQIGDSGGASGGGKVIVRDLKHRGFYRDEPTGGQIPELPT